MTKSRNRELPLVAIVGRPNVGKSTLFNRLIGERRAIVGDEPGITRDRIYGEAEWNGQRFAMVDTGGIVPDDEAVIPANIFRQAAVAIDEAVSLIWVVDARKGVTPLDEELVHLLRETGKRVFVAANKVDSARLEDEASDFHRFGFAEVFPISAEHGNGIGDMLDALAETIETRTRGVTETRGVSETPALAGGPVPTGKDAGEPAGMPALQPREINLAIVGRPNVGKSSLLNRLLGEERAIVSPVAGTTRDSVDTLLKTDAQTFRIIDTAGIRRKGKTTAMAEKLSVIMARKSLERADVAIVLLDAEEGVTALDATIAGYAVEAGCSIILALNKWDLLADKDSSAGAHFERKLRDSMKFLSWAPVVTTSALTGQRVQKLLPVAVRAKAARNLRIPTSRLNEFFEREVKSGVTPAKTFRGSRLHVQYITQTAVRPPTFVVFTAGGKAGLHFSFVRHLENRLREEFDFFGTPIRIIERHKSRKRRR